MVPKPKLDGGAVTYDEFHYLLAHAKNFDINKYSDSADPQPRKPLWRLWEEIERGDIRLKLNEKTGIAVRHGCSLRTLIQTPTMKLIETSRLYENNGELVPTVNAGHSLSETMRLLKGKRHHENHLQCVVRCLGEELHQYNVDLSKLRYLSIQEIPVLRPSSVYPGIYSEMVIFNYEWNIEKPFELEGPLIRDTGTTVQLKWFDR